MELIDLFGREEWQKLLDDISERTGLVAMLLDDNSALLLKSGTQNCLCDAIREKPENRTFVCAMSASSMTGEAKATQQPVNEFCEAGMKRFTVPVIRDGKLIGQVAGCGIITDPDEVDAGMLAVQMDVSEETAAGLIEKVRVVSAEDIDKIVAEVAAKLKG